MTDAKTILKMIETVDPSNTAKLDEIDARVWCYLRNYTYSYMEHYSAKGKAVKKIRYDDNGVFGLFTSNTKYTQSRDALKAIRPEGWFPISYYSEPCGYALALEKLHTGDHYQGNDETRVHYCSTEELAELHAVIQAIECERGQK